MRTLIPSLILALGLGCGGSSPAPKPKAPKADKPAAPALVARTPVGPPKAIDGTRLRQELARSSDRPRIYNFWATWCPPCIAEMPLLRTFATSHPDVDMILVNVDAKALHDTRVKAVIRENALTDIQHLLLDAEDPNPVLQEAVKDWPEQIPLTLVVDRTGREVERYTESLETSMLLEAVARAR